MVGDGPETARDDRDADGSRAPARRRSGRIEGLLGALARRFRVDPRALAALRISLGVLLIADLAIRSRDLVVFYTDAGVLPRDLLAAAYPTLSGLAVLHGLSGAAWVQAALFGLAGSAAVALALGYRTRLATAISLVFLVSLHARNPVILNAGDSVLRRLLFWGLFLPLGGRWSVDAVRSDRRQGSVATVASAALLLQVVVIYLANGLFKLRGERWLDGTAVAAIFSLDHLTVLLGDVLATVPPLLAAAGVVWTALVLAAPLFLVLTGWPRAALAGLLAAGHVGMALTLRLGLFPLISIAALLPFLPPAVWDRTGTMAPGLGSWCTARLHDCDRLLPDVPALPGWAAIPTDRIATVVVATLLVLVLVWNGATLGYVDAPASVTDRIDPEERRWDMFAPNPRTTDGWFVVVGELDGGRTVDVLREGPVRWQRPPELASTYPSHRWLLYMLGLRDAPRVLGPSFAAYQCRRWDDRHASSLASLEVNFMAQPTRVDGPEPIHRIHLGEYDCPPSSR